MGYRDGARLGHRVSRMRCNETTPDTQTWMQLRLRWYPFFFSVFGKSRKRKQRTTALDSLMRCSVVPKRTKRPMKKHAIKLKGGGKGERFYHFFSGAPSNFLLCKNRMKVGKGSREMLCTEAEQSIPTKEKVRSMS